MHKLLRALIAVAIFGGTFGRDLNANAQHLQWERSAKATTSFDLDRYGFQFHYDASKWAKISTDDSGRTLFRLKGRDGYGMIVAERFSIPPENLLPLVLQSMQQNAPDAKVEPQGRRAVNGSTMLAARIAATVMGNRLVYLCYFASGGFGTVQVMAYTLADLLPDHQQEFEEFLNGIGGWQRQSQ